VVRASGGAARAPDRAGDLPAGGGARGGVPAAGTARIGVLVHGGDPVSRAGIVSQLRAGGEFRLLGEDDADAADVSMVIADQMDAETAITIRSLRLRGVTRIVLLVTRIDDKALLAAVEAGVAGVVRRHQATQQALATAIRTAAAGEGTLPPDLLGRLLSQVGQLQRQVLSPRGLTFAGLTEREIGVLRLLAEGLDTVEVGRRLFYSERTVKNIIHDVTSRLELRNRTHAVAYAIREGLI
jgi:DNA-binding NarL/FixJ family response regulator